MYGIVITYHRKKTSFEGRTEVFFLFRAVIEKRLYYFYKEEEHKIFFTNNYYKPIISSKFKK